MLGVAGAVLLVLGVTTLSGGSAAAPDVPLKPRPEPSRLQPMAPMVRRLMEDKGRGEDVPVHDAISPEAEELRGRLAEAQERWLVLVRDTLTGHAFATTEMAMGNHWLGDGDDFRKYLQPMDPAVRRRGGDWPMCSIAMSGTMRLDNVRDLLQRAVAEGVPGDYLDCGTWRGGAAIMARATLDVVDPSRRVWVADSFRGLPPPRDGRQGDHDGWSRMAYLRVSLETVRANFRSMLGRLDEERVRFCEGFFVDSLPLCQVERIAVLRADGDMWESMMDILYLKSGAVSPGGYIIIDDYESIPETRRATDEFRSHHGIASPIIAVGDGMGAYWQKTEEYAVDMDYYRNKIK